MIQPGDVFVVAIVLAIFIVLIFRCKYQKEKEAYEQGYIRDLYICINSSYEIPVYLYQKDIYIHVYSPDLFSFDVLSDYENFEHDLKTIKSRIDYRIG